MDLLRKKIILGLIYNNGRNVMADIGNYEYSEAARDQLKMENDAESKRIDAAIAGLQSTDPELKAMSERYLKMHLMFAPVLWDKSREEKGP